MLDVREGMTFHEKVAHFIALIPEGKVATYGQIANLAGSPRAARQVAWVLKHKGDNLPWHRVINAKGEISLKRFDGFIVQRDLLVLEGVEVSDEGKINLRLFQWRS